MQSRVFSSGRIAAIAANTFTELVRLKVFYFLLLFALFLIGSSFFMARLSFQQELQVLKDVSLGAISIFTSLLAVITTARLLPQEIEDRTITTILAKPVPRYEYLIGKLGGVFFLLAISTALMAAFFFAILCLRGETSVFSVNLLPSVAIIYLKACLLASLTLFISTFATTNLFTLVVAAFVYFIGHLQAPAREFWLHEQGGGWASRIFLAFVALVFPDLQLFDFADEVVAGSMISLGLFAKTAGLGCFYILIYLLLAVAVFSGKEL